MIKAYRNLFISMCVVAAFHCGFLSAAIGPDFKSAWNPQGKSIFALLDVEEALFSMQIKALIDNEEEYYRAKLDSIESAVQRLRADAHEQGASLVSEAGPPSEPKSISAQLEEKEAELIKVKSILGHLPDIELILRDDEFKKLYRRFIKGLRMKFDKTREFGDGLKHLALFMAYSERLKNESYQHETLDESKHRSEFQAFVQAKLEEKSPLVTFLPPEFARDIFQPVDETVELKPEPVFWVDLKMSRAAKWLGVAGICTSIILAGVSQWRHGDPHKEAVKAFQPFVQDEIRGDEKHNLPDGEEAGFEVFRDAAERAIPDLIGK